MRRFLIAALVVAPLAGYGVAAVAEDAHTGPVAGEVTSGNDKGSDGEVLAKMATTASESVADADSIGSEAIAGDEGKGGVLAAPLTGTETLGEAEGESESDD